MEVNPTSILLTRNDDSCISKRTAGYYFHKPEPYCNDIYVRDCGLILYYYTACQCHGTGCWRLTPPNEQQCANPEHEDYGCGICRQFPSYMNCKMETRYKTKGTDPYTMTFNWTITPSVITLENIQDPNQSCSGTYFHAPESFNLDMYRRADGHILYFFTEKESN
jgi:hypothetical protein